MSDVKITDALGIADMIVEEGGQNEMVFEIVRDKKHPETTLSIEAVEGLAHGFEGFIIGNLKSFWRKRGKPAQRVRVHVKIAMDAEGLPQEMNGMHRNTLNLDVPVDQIPMPYYSLPDRSGDV